MTDLSKLGITQEQLEQALNSPLHNQLYKLIEEQNARLREIPENAKRLALALFQMNKLDVIPNLWRSFQKRRIPSIQEFLTEEFIGSNHMWYSTDTAWRREIYDIFDPNKTIQEVVLTGAIGTAKSSNATIMHHYNKFRIDSLRVPQLAMGSGAMTPMSLQLMSVTREKSNSVLLSPFKNLLQNCKYYQQVKSEIDFQDFQSSDFEHITPWIDDDEALIFPNNVKIVTGSKDYHALGEALFGGMLDEAERRRGDSVEETMDLYKQIHERMRTRFLLSRYVLCILCSSVAQDTGVMATYIKEKQNDLQTKIVSFNIWDIKFPEEIRKGHGWALRGTKTHQSRNLTQEEIIKADSDQFELPPGCELVKYPIRFWSDFEHHVEQSLRNLAGKYTIGEDRPFDDLSTIEDKTLTPLIKISAPRKDVMPLWRKLPLDIFVRTPIGFHLKRYPNCFRYCHADLADSGVAGISVVHKEKSKTGKIYVVADLILRVSSPDRMSLQSIFQLVIDFKEILGMKFKKLTADQYQSTAFLELMEAKNIAEEVNKLSVDKNLDPYANLSNLVAEGAFKCGLASELKQEMSNIFFSKGKPYVYQGRKDLCDSVVGSCFLAMSCAEDYPIHYYEDYVSLQSSESIEKRIPPGFRKVSA